MSDTSGTAAPRRGATPAKILMVVAIASMIGSVGCFFGFIALGHSYAQTLPHIADSVTGRIYPYTNKGQLVFLTAQEESLLNNMHLFSMLGVVIAIAAGFAAQLIKERTGHGHDA